MTPVATLAVGATVDVSFELTAGAGVSSTSLTGLTMDLKYDLPTCVAAHACSVCVNR